MRNSPSCGCCGGTVCYQYADDLSVDTDWVEESGNWTFASGEATTSDSNAQLIYQGVDSAAVATEPFAFQVYTSPARYNAASATLKCGRLIFNWEDSSNYWFGEIIQDKPDATTVYLTLNIGYVDGGVETIVESDTFTYTPVFLATVTYAELCWQNGIVTLSGVLSGSFNTDNFSIFTNAPFVLDGIFGFGTGDQTGMLDAAITAFAVDITSEEDAECVACDSHTLISCEDCDQGYAAEEYSLEVSGFSVGTCGDCDALNGTFTLTHDTGCTWRSAEITDICGATVQYRLDVDADDGIRVSLEQIDPASGDLFSWLATADDDGGAPWSCLRWTDLLLDEDTGDDVGCGPVPDTVSLTAVRPW